jgi:two-component system cell cycle sensor histidine kinase/response regulator CckA
MISINMLESMPKKLLVTLTLIIAILIGFIDYITGWQISLSLFYLIPISVAAWCAGGRAGTIIVIFCTLVSLIADLMWGVPYTYLYIPYWNAFTRCILFCVIVRMIVVIKNHLRTLETAVEEKTSSLLQVIAEHESTEKKLELIRFSVDNITDAIYWVGIDGSFWLVNDTACNMLGYSRQELLSMGVPDIDVSFPPGVWPSHLKKLRHEKYLRLETFHRRKDGSNIPVEVTANYFIHNGIEYNCAVVRDMTERKVAEAEKQKLLLQLSQAQKNESIGRLAGGIAHDFNNLLTPIIGYSDLLKQNLQPGSRELEKVNHISMAAEKAKILTQQLLSYARKQVLEMKVVDLNDVVLSFFKILRMTVRESVDMRLGLTRETHGILADRHQLEQIIMNLIINAQDAIEDKGSVTIETAQVDIDEEYSGVEVKPGKYMLLAITDTGCGMDAETLSQLFEPFYTTKNVGEGTGLGLATVYGLVKQHEGYIVVSSKPGEGSAFKIYFPIANDKPVEDQAVVQEYVQLNGGGRTILLVDDSEMVRNIVYDFLDGQGFNVIKAEDPNQALQLANGKHIDLLVTDVVMPVMNGPELYRKLAEYHLGLKVIYMSGYSNNAIVDHGAFKKGINFIQKPFATNDLAKIIETALNGDTN